MTRRQGTAQFVAGCMLLALAGCGTVDLFGEYDIPESPDVAAAPWPRLVDVPEAPPVGVYTDDVPDPAIGIVTLADLGQAARGASARAARLAGTEQGAEQPPQRDAAVAAAASTRAAALARPVISQAERAEMLSRAARARQQD